MAMQFGSHQKMAVNAQLRKSLRRQKMIAGAIKTVAAIRATQNEAALAIFLKRLAVRDLPVWAIVRRATGRTPLTDDEKALICYVVAPELSARTPGSVLRRRRLGSW